MSTTKLARIYRTIEKQSIVARNPSLKSPYSNPFPNKPASLLGNLADRLISGSARNNPLSTLRANKDRGFNIPRTRPLSTPTQIG